MTELPLRVLVVDDSVVVRKLVTEILAADPGIEVVGTAANGRIALAKIAQLAPDLVTLDVEMPEMDGLATLKELRRIDRRLPVVMFSTLTERGAAATMDALLAGANDYVTKPANVGSMQAAVQRVTIDLVPKIKALCGRATTPTATTAETPSRPQGRRAGLTGGRVEIVVIGVSTGGPNALADMLTALPADLPVPVVIVQHMPPTFTRYLAERLDRQCAIRVAEARGGEIVRAGEVWIAPGGHHLRVVADVRGPALRIDDGPPENSCRPAVDVLFRSAASAFGAGTLALVMTGMGYDGRRGAREIKAAGGRVIAQDAATSVVWGMPGSVVEDGSADAVLPLSSLAPQLVSLARQHRALTTVAPQGRLS